MKIMGDKDTKLCLSDEDLSFLQNTIFFDKKRKVTNQLMAILGELEQEIQSMMLHFPDLVPIAALNKRGKISKGENYQGLPYLILDHPATFGKAGIFAFRTLIWWGNPISFTFHLSGIYLDQFKERLLTALDKGSFADAFICINNNQFEHHFGANNYQKVSQIVLEKGAVRELLKNKNFLKIGITFPLQDIDDLWIQGQKFLQEIFQSLR